MTIVSMFSNARERLLKMVLTKGSTLLRDRPESQFRLQHAVDIVIVARDALPQPDFRTWRVYGLVNAME
jgi:hypothetical protein